MHKRTLFFTSWLQQYWEKKDCGWRITLFPSAQSWQRPSSRTIASHLQNLSPGGKVQGIQRSTTVSLPLPPFPTRSSQDNTAFCLSPKVSCRAAAMHTKTRRSHLWDGYRSQTFLTRRLQNIPCPHSTDPRLKGCHVLTQKQLQHLLPEGPGRAQGFPAESRASI